MFSTSWFMPKSSGAQDNLFRENQLLKSQIQELLNLEETGFFIELDSLLKAILKKALILCKAESSFFALPKSDPALLDVRICNLILDEKMERIRELFKTEYQRWQESESELITIEDFILLPLIRRHRMMGIIGLKLNASAPENVCEILPILAKQAASSLESAILYERMFKRLMVLSNVFILGKEIVSNIDVDKLVDKFLSIARDGTNSEVAAIYLMRNEEKLPSLQRVQTASGEGRFANGPESGYSPLIQKVGIIREPVMLEHLDTGSYAESEPMKIQGLTLRNTIAIPMTPGERYLGVIQIANKQHGDPFTPEDLDLLKILSSQIAFVIQNSDLFHNLQHAYFDTLAALTQAIDAKDSYTHGHSERVTQYSVELARAMGLEEPKIENLKLAGMLHDIGKIGIPENILNKPGRLTDEEFDVIKSHPELGVRILHRVEFLAPVIPIIRHHHERFDGHGYPSGLGCEEIPYGARLVAIADTYDAMTSDRPYRKAMEMETALAEIIRCKGTQFDPELADAFVKMMRGNATRESASA
ncbi:MAG TPA: HD domain-containing protein [Candidatus Ozemobacteraceae bacterium]|nr:HD domain-containing protein [Candidatus Ozemobacteraceae bacterium]